MALVQLDSENADRDLTSSVTVLTHTPDASSPMLCQGYIVLGDGAKDLDGTGGNFELVITIGGQTIQPSPEIIAFGTEIRSAIWTTQFLAPSNTEVVFKVKSPNAGDTDVDVTAYLFDLMPMITAAFDPATDSLQSIRDAIAAAAPVEYAPDGSSVITTGNEDANTFADCALDNGTRWTIGDENGTNTIDVICEFNMGSNRLATGLAINGYFDRSGGGGYIVDVYAYNYTTASWDKLSAGTADTEMRNRASDKDYSFALTTAHTDHITSLGEVKINFRSTRATTAGGDVLYLDHVVISGVAAGATSPEAIAQAVHSELDAHLTHIPLFTGEVRYVDADGGDDANNGETPSAAYATITACIAASVAGEYITVKAGTYAEAVDLNLEGLELHGEIGTEITGSGGVPLTISGDHCRVSLVDVVPDAGQIGCVITGDEAHLIHVKSHDTGLIGFQVASGSIRSIYEDCQAGGFSSIGFDVKGPSNIFNRCTVRGDGGSETGFNLSDTLAHRNDFNNCATIDCATAGWDVDSGADDNLFNSCADSDGCGARVDDGANNTWRDFKEADTPVVDATSILAEVVEDQGSITLKQALQILIAALAGVTTSTGKVLKTPNGSATRITMTIDTTNNERDTVTLSF